MGIYPVGAYLKFVIKIFSIGAVLFVGLAASVFVGQVVNDRIKYQNQALENQSGDKSSVLIFGKRPGFDEETGMSVYRLVDRVLKYSILFIFLTFLAFFLFEVIYKLKLHPIQYLLVGLGLAEFYLLLLAFMEHIGFLAAYIIAAAMTVPKTLLRMGPPAYLDRGVLRSNTPWRGRAFSSPASASP